MSAIRDVVIRVALEQKQSSLKVPPLPASIAGGSKSSPASKQSSEEKQYDKEAKEAVAAYSRIMGEKRKKEEQAARESEKAAAAAERAYDKEANAAVAAYSRILKANKERAEKEIQSQKAIAAAHSAVIGTYAQTAGAALQMSRGIAFVVAANDEQAESFVRALAKAQGYFDLAVGSIQVIKGVNDVTRQTAILMDLQAASAGRAAAATTTLAVAGAGAAATAKTGVAATVAATTATWGLSYAVAAVGAVAGIAVAPILLIGAAVAAVGLAATLAYQRFSNSTVEKQAKKDAEAAENSAKRQTDALVRVSKQRQEISNVKSSRIDSNDSAKLAAELAKQQEARAKFVESAKAVPMKLDTRESEKKSLENKLSLQEQNVAMIQNEQQLQDKYVESLKNEQAVAKDILKTAQDTLATEENRNRSENSRLGLMSRADQNQAKKLLEKKASGQELSIRDARKAQSLGILKEDVEAAGVKEAEKRGLTGARERAGETKPLEQAKKDMVSANNTVGLAIKDLDEQLKEGAKQQEELADKLVKAMNGKFATAEMLERVIQGIEDRDKANSTKSFWQAKQL